jgi:hypothetical protein
MWENIRWEGGDNWISASIWQGTCIAVTDESYMRLLYPDIHSTVFVLECTSGMGRIWGSFPEPTKCACSYRGELVELMAIHLILLATNEVNVGLLQGRVQIYSDCLGGGLWIKSKTYRREEYQQEARIGTCSKTFW